MKKYILALFLVIVLPIFTSACDICGCGVGNAYIGILPDFSKHIFGLRYRYNSIWTHVGVGGNFTYLTTKETYHIAEAWGGWNISKKFRVMVSLPYSFNERVNHETRNNKSGLGDISLSGYYQLVNNRRMVFKDRLLVQSLWVGTGIKLATGKYSQSDKNTANDNANLFQLGTGSNDFNIAAMYDIRLQDIGINLYGNYKMTTVNAYNYKYGNKFNINAQAYYKFRIKNKLTIAPNAGIQYEQTNNDFDKGFNVATSGGNLLLGTAGIEAAFGKVAIGGNLQTPFCQNLANGIVKANNRVMAHVAFIF